MIIGRREYQQLLAVARHYRAIHGVDLATELDRRIIGSVGSLLAGACQHKVLAEVQYLHRAGKSNRKYETLRKKDTAIEVFCEASLAAFTALSCVSFSNPAGNGTIMQRRSDCNRSTISPMHTN